MRRLPAIFRSDGISEHSGDRVAANLLPEMLWNRFCMALLPKPPCNFERINLALSAPGDFIAGLVELSMMATAQRHREFVADFLS